MKETIHPNCLSYIFNDPFYLIPEKTIIELVEPAISHQKNEPKEETSAKSSVQIFNEPIWFLIVPSNKKEISTEEQDLLDKTIHALKISKNDVNIINVFDIQNLKETILQSENKKIVIYGFDQALKELNLKDNQITLQGSKQILHTNSLKELQLDLEKKKQWWQLMSLLFKTTK
jgi:DNA polymerase III psi subunit